MNIATCIPGLEDITEKEVKGKKIFPGRVSFSGKIKDFKSVLTIYSLTSDFEFTNLDDFSKKISKLKFKVNKSFKVVCNRQGNHNFNSSDVQKEIGIPLINQGFQLDFKNPSTVIYVDILDSKCFVGYLEKENLSKRSYRIRLSNQTLNPCLAYALVSLSGFKKNSTLLDPFCRDGIIAIEASLSNKGKVIALDSSMNNIRNSSINAKTAKADITFKQIPVSAFKEKVEFIVTFPPVYSINREHSFVIQAWKDFFAYIPKILKNKMIIINQKEDIKDYFGNLKILEERKIKIGNLEYFIFILQN